MTLDDQFRAAGVEVVHHFVAGLYAKETHIPAGVTLTQHSHGFDHLSAVMKGACVVEVNGRRTMHHAGEFVTVKAHQVHAVTAVSDTVWACLHATDVTDPELVDAALMKEAA